MRTEAVVNEETALGFLLEYSSQLLDCQTLDDIFALAVKTSKERLSARVSSAFLFSKEGRLERRFTAGLSSAFPLEVYQRGQGLVGRTANTPEEFGYPNLASDIDTDSRIQEDLVVVGYVQAYNDAILVEYGFEERATSALAVPLNGHHRTFGVLRMVNKLDPETDRVSGKPFTDVDRDWLVMLARLTANAAVNVKRRNRLSTMAAFQLLGEDNEKVFLDRVAKSLTDSTSSYSACLIHAFDRRTDELKILGHSKNFRPLIGVERRDVRVKIGQGVCGQVFNSGLSHRVVRDLRDKSEGFLFPQWVEFNGFVSLICLTIKNRRGGPDFGTLQLLTKYEYIFDKDDIQYLESLAHQISTVLRTLQENKDLQGINQLADQISQETTMEGVLQTCVEKMPVILGFDRALGIVTVPGSSTCRIVASTNEKEVRKSFTNDTILATLAKRPKVRAFRSIRASRVPDGMEDLLAATESLVVLPIPRMGSSFRYVILLANSQHSGRRSGRLKGFHTSLASLLQTIASQVSSSLRKNELLEELAIEARRQATLQRVLREISSTDLQGPATILKVALRELVETLQVDVALLGLFSWESEGLSPIVVHGLKEEEVTVISERLQRAMASPCEDTRYRSNLEVFRHSKALKEVAFPLLSQEQVIGLLALGSSRPGTFDEAALSFIETLLSGISGKVQNNGLFRAAFTLGTVRFDEITESRICEILAEKTSEMMGTPVTCVWLRRQVDGLEILELGSIHGAEIRGRWPHVIERSEGGLTWRSVEAGELRLTGDSAESDRNDWYKFHEDIQASGSGFLHPEFVRENRLKSMISIPLVLDQKVLGVINTYTRRRYWFYARASHLLQNLALSGAMALRSAELTRRLSQINVDILNKAQLANPGTVALSFSHDISHTMNHVNALLSSLIILTPRRLQEEDPGKNVIASLTESTDYLRELFRSLVRYAAGKPLRYVSTQLSGILDYVQYICSVRLQTKRIRSSIEVADIWLDCDKNQMEQLFVNLFNNAIDAIAKKMTKGGQIEISARLTDSSSVEIQFKDNGIGMSAEEREHAFDLFFTTKGDEGTGFGLPICRKIVEDNHHGKIWVAPKTQEGTMIFIKLPRQQRKDQKGEIET
jgi:signal transduction histidine kinase/GAF domain-containing protein